VTALEVTGSALSSSLLTVSGSGYATSASLSTASGSFDTRVATIESKYATTGSNTFTSTQVVSGSILQSGSFTTTGTIIAQTINVQTVTSSVVYSSGSNVFGNDIGNSQRFTGSVLITGSLTIAGASSATSYSGVTIYGSTIACSPIGCFATSCATSFIGGTMSGTTIYGSTAVCSPVGKFSSCIDAGSGTFTGALGISTATGVNLTYLLTPSGWNGAKHRFGVPVSGDSSILSFNWNGSARDYAGYGSSVIGLTDGQITLGVGSGADPTTRLTIASTGAATFSNTISGTTIYGSTAVCSPVGKFTTCIDACSGYFSGNINSLQNLVLTRASTSAGSNIEFRTSSTLNWYIGTRGLVNNNFYIVNEGLTANNLILDASTGAATFACSVTAGTQFIGSNTNTDPVTATTTASVLALNGSSANNNFGLGVGAIRNSAYDIWFQTGVANGGGYRWYIGTSEKMTMSSTGNVGIGCTTPGYALDVVGQIRSTTSSNISGLILSNITAGSYSQIAFDGNNADAYIFKGNSTYSSYGGANSFNIYNEGPLAFHSSTTSNIMFMTAAGLVGIGTCSPSEKLHLYNSTAATTLSLVIENSINNYNSQINFKSIYGGSTARSYLIGSNISIADGSWEVYDATVAAARLVITNDGTMLVGGASSSGAYNLSLGNATANTYYQVRSTNTNSLYGSDTRGTWMGNLSGKEAYMNASTFVPGVDNSTSLGTSSYRWSVVYAVNGSIQTSDERQKTNISTSDLGLDFINKLNPVSYKWKVGGNDVEYSSVEDENIKLTPTSVATPKAGVRTHYGLIAQQVKEILGDKDFGGYVYDTETDTMSLRYDQFISPLIKAIQELKAENDIFKTCLGIS
jgi:hypothetical protein